MERNQQFLKTIQDYYNWEEGFFTRPSLQTLTDKERFLRFASRPVCCFDRTNADGHATGSALVVNPSLDKVLLTHHAKLNLWLQLGGHATPTQETIQDVAWTEACEESGLWDLRFFDLGGFPLLQPNGQNALPFDVDIHTIPARPHEPSHLHFDVRFLLQATHENVTVCAESLALKWVPLEQISEYTSETSMLRQIEKLSFLLGRL